MSSLMKNNLSEIERTPDNKTPEIKESQGGISYVYIELNEWTQSTDSAYLLHFLIHVIKTAETNQRGQKLQWYN